MRRRHTVLTILLCAALAAAALVLGSCAKPEAEPLGRKLMIVGIDGMEWDIMGPMLEAGKLPTFAKLIHEGAFGEIRSLDTLESPVIWTSIATGMLPEKHGISGFVKRRPAAGSDDRVVPFTANVRLTKAIWEILGERGLEVGVLGWLVTWPAQPVNGYMVSSYYECQWETQIGGETYDITYPPDLWEDIAGFRLTEKDVGDEEVGRFLTAPVGDDRNLRAKRLAVERSYAYDESIRRVGRYLQREWPTDFYAIYFRGVDPPCHLFWTDMFPDAEPPPDEAEAEIFAETIPEYYVYMDEILAEIIETVDENTTVIVTSDHGHSGPKPEGDSYKFGLAMHDPTGVLILWGKDIVPGVELTDAHVTDITPTVLALFGLPVAEDMDGKVLTEAIESSFLEEQPVLSIATYETEPQDGGEEPIESPVDEEIKERLRSLGYIE